MKTDHGPSLQQSICDVPARSKPVLFFSALDHVVELEGSFRSFFDTPYFSTITMYTVGYGNITASSDAAGYPESKGDDLMEQVVADGARGGSDRNGSGNGSVKDTGQCSPANAHRPPRFDLGKARASRQGITKK